MYLHEGNREIQTVAGIIPSNELGYCQCHEHIFISKGKSFEISPSLWMDDLNTSTAELMLYKAVGGESLVDAQPVGCGRIAGFLKKASKDSKVHIIASTGFHKLIFYKDNHWIHTIDVDSLSNLYISELIVGMYSDADDHFPLKRIDSKAGIIKTAVDSFGIEGDYIKLFGAAAAASLETGFPILCHIEKGVDAFDVIEFFYDKGIEPEWLILCHLDRAKYDVSYHREIADTGAWLEYDTIARFKYHNNNMEIKLIQAMLEAGFEDRILLGLDTTRERLVHYGGIVGLDYLKKSFIPLMLDSEISKDAVNKMTVVNPGKALSKRK